MLRIDCVTVERDTTRVDPCLETAARITRQGLRQGHVEAHAGALGCEHEIERRVSRRHGGHVSGQCRGRFGRQGVGYNRRHSPKGAFRMQATAQIPSFGHSFGYSGATARRLGALILATIFALMLGGCGLLPEGVGKDETAGWSAERLYRE